MPPAKFFAALILTPLLAIAAPAPITLPQIQTQAQQGNPEAQARLGEAYLNSNLGIAQDCAQAAAYYQQADQNNDIAGQYLNGCGAAFDYPKALALLQQAHRAGNKKSARYLGIIYERGLGVAQDYAQAAAYYQQADQNNDITGQYRLAKLYEQGLGVPRDFARARALYLKHTARQDHITAPSFQTLGDLYRYGLGVNKNPREAQKWYRLAKQSAAVK